MDGNPILKGLLCLLGLFSAVNSHVRLTYPKARWIDIDFLDNSRTIGPCGMPTEPGKDAITKLYSGMQFNVTWHLSYAHRGGFQLQLLEGNNIQHWLTPEDQWLGTNDVTSQTYRVAIPAGYTCNQCTLRLLRQASEWGGRYRFWSCAEVSIQQAQTLDCNGQSEVNGKCQCDDLYKGPNCQYKDECDDHSDCGDHGRCIDIDATSFPVHQCFCEKGWFGFKCEKESPVHSIPTPDERKGVYTEKALNDEYTMFYRVIEDLEEVEVILEAKSTTWLGIGWRPRGLKDTCRNWPISSTGAKAPKAEPEGEGEPESEGEPEGEGEPKGEGEPEGEGEGEPEAEVNKDFPKIPANCHGSGCDYEAAWRFNTTHVKFTVKTKAASNQWIGIGFSTEQCYFESTCNSNGNLYMARKEADGTLHKGEWNPWSVQGVQTNNIAHPKVKCENGFCHFEFTRAIDTHESTDLQFGEADSQCYYFVYPNIGIPQGNGAYLLASNVHATSTFTYSSEKICIKPSLSKVEVNPCEVNTFMFPPNCGGGENCNYVAAWTSNDDDTITVIVQAKQPQNRWTGFAFGPTTQMLNMDVVYGFIDNGNSKVIDGFVRNNRGYQTPTVDSQQNLLSSSIKYENGMYEMTFTRARNTGDFEDHVFSDNTCLYFIFPVGGGAFNGDVITRHTNTPIKSTEKICIKKCVAPETEPETEGEPHAEGTAEPGAEVEPENGANAEGETEPEAENGANPEGETEPEAEGKAEGEAEPEGENGSHAEGEPEGEGEPEAEPEGEGEPESEPESGQASNLHAMDCTDIIIGAARDGTLSRIHDYYTRDRSTPRDDAVYKGEDSLTAAVGEEKDGKTTILFRRKIKAVERADYTLEETDMHLIFARGQEPGNYIHSPNSGIETGEAKDLGFYRTDELKYHGHSTQRGISTINFFETVEFNPCVNTFMFPSNCGGGKDCEYVAAWTYNDDDTFTVIVQAKQPQNRWTGFAFGPTTAMQNMDVVYGFIDNGNSNVIDGFVSNDKGYQTPTVDSKQSLLSSSIKYENGMYEMTFTRERNTGDSEDHVFNDDTCLYFIFPVGGGAFNGNVITQHTNTPIKSNKKICIKKCVATDKPIYASVKIGENYISAFDNLNSPESQDLIEKIIPPVRSKLKQSLGNFESVAAKKLSPGSVVVDMEITVKTDGSKEDYDNSVKNVETALTEELSDGMLGDVPAAKEFSISETRVTGVPTTKTPKKETDKPITTESRRRKMETLEIILIVVICVLVFVGLLVLMIKCIEASRKGEECLGFGSRKKRYAMESKNGFTKTVL